MFKVNNMFHSNIFPITKNTSSMSTIQTPEQHPGRCSCSFIVDFEQVLIQVSYSTLYKNVTKLQIKKIKRKEKQVLQTTTHETFTLSKSTIQTLKKKCEIVQS